MKRTFENCTLADMDRGYFDHGSVSKEDMIEYLQLWNDTPGRFTVAKLGADHVYQIDKK